MPDFDPSALTPDNPQSLMARRYLALLTDQNQALRQNELAQAQSQPMQSGQGPGPVAAPPPVAPVQAPAAQAQATGDLPSPAVTKPVNTPSPQTGIQMPPTSDSMSQSLGYTPVPESMKQQGGQYQPPTIQMQSLQQMQDAQRQYIEANKVTESVADQIAKYHPSLAKRILITTLGAFAGINNPALGVQVTREGLKSGPLQLQLEAAQRKEAAAKERFEMAAGMSTAAGRVDQQALEAKRIQADIDKNIWERSDPAFQQKLLLARERGEKQIELELTDKQGNVRPGYYDFASKQTIDTRTGKQADWNEVTSSSKGMSIQQEKTKGALSVEDRRQLGREAIANINFKSRKLLQAWGDADKKDLAVSIEKMRQEGRMTLQQDRDVHALELAKTKIEMMAKIPPTQVRSAAYYATNAIQVADTLNKTIDNLGSLQIGPIQGRVLDYWTNKLGLQDPQFAYLDQNLHSFAVEAARIQSGSSQTRSTLIAQYMKDFSEAQTVDDLKARISAVKDQMLRAQALGGIASGSTVNPAGGTTPPPGQQPPVQAPGTTPPPGAKVNKAPIFKDGKWVIPQQ